MKKRCIAWALLLILVLFPASALAADPEEETGEVPTSEIYTMQDASGQVIMRKAGRLFQDDEYISGDNKLYRVIAVDHQTHTATAQYLGEEPLPEMAQVQAVQLAFHAQAAQGQTANKKKLVAMYSTHSDESYEPSDGTHSKHENAGIYDVSEELKKELESLGIEVKLDKTTHLPHDAGAYRRSRSTAASLLKQRPAALLDIHRDGIPDPKEYLEELDGDKITKVRLLVGRSNPNAKANREFAKKIKAVADKEYPGLIKDIFVGKGNYNQELYPQSILLEFGTHTTSKERAKASTKFIADVLSRTLFGGTAKAAPQENEGETPQNRSSSGAMTGILWILGVAILGAVIYALSSTGSFSAMKEKLARGGSEITGGLMGKKPKDEDRDKR